MWIEAFQVSVYTDAPNKMVDLQLRCNVSNSGIAAGLQVGEAHNYLQSGQTIMIPFKGYINENMYVNAYLFPFIDATDTTKKMAISITPVGMHEITADLNFNAEKIIWGWGGDSIMHGLGATGSTGIYGFMLRDYYKDKGQDVRFSNNGWSGLSSTDFVMMLKRNMVNLEGRPDLLLYSLGTNDVNGGFDAAKQAAYTNNINFAIAYKQRHYPNAKLLMLGSAPNQNATTEGNLAIARGILSARAAAANDVNILYKNLGDSFTNTDTTKYNTSMDTATTRTHPNDAGNTAIFNNLKPFLDSNLPRI